MAVTGWEENTERRVGILEAKMDKLLDPENGIYPTLMQSQTRLQHWAIGILSALLVTIMLLVANLAVRLITGAE